MNSYLKSTDKKEGKMTIKIFHTADLHLGMKFARYPAIQNELINARYEALERMVEMANKEECELFIVAGDLFDRVTVKPVEIKKAVDILNGFAGDLVLVLPGNHDFIPVIVVYGRNFPSMLVTEF